MRLIAICNEIESNVVNCTSVLWWKKKENEKVIEIY